MSKLTTIILLVQNPGVWTDPFNDNFERFTNIIGLLTTLSSRSTSDGWNGVSDELEFPLLDIY